MKADAILFTDIADAHNKYLQMLQRKEMEELTQLRSKVISLWTGTKKRTSQISYCPYYRGNE
jgi:hypothetical protein